MKRIIGVGVLSAAMLSSVNAHAAKAELKLIGTITPAACVPNFTGGATIDYGNIPAGTLNSTTQTNLPIKTTTINVTCDAPTIFYLNPADERTATLDNSVNPTPAITGAGQKFGLGAAPGGVNIGAYGIIITSTVVDTGTTQRIRSLNGGSTWNTSWAGVLQSDGSSLIGFTNGINNTVPSAHTSATMNLDIHAALTPAQNLPLANDITLDGLATIEVVYP